MSTVLSTALTGAQDLHVLAGESYLDLVTDPAHIAFEATYDALSALLLLLLLRPLLRRIAERVHRDVDAAHAAHAAPCTSTPATGSVSPDDALDAAFLAALDLPRNGIPLKGANPTPTAEPNVKVVRR